METLILAPSAVAQWYTLVNDARTSASIKLTEELESYLVFLLMRFSENPEFFNSILAIDFLESQNQIGEKRRSDLRDVGDKCLLYAGLFPGKARKRRVKISYYVKMGQLAYTSLSISHQSASAALFKNLGQQFVALMDTLHSIRALNTHSIEFLLNPIEAHELWLDTKSTRVYQLLKMYTSSHAFFPQHTSNSLN